MSLSRLYSIEAFEVLKFLPAVQLECLKVVNRKLKDLIESNHEKYLTLHYFESLLGLSNF